MGALHKRRASSVVHSKTLHLHWIKEGCGEVMNPFRRAKQTKATVTVSALLCTCIATGSAAQDASWDFTGYIYLWGASVGGETITGQDVDVSFSDVLDNLDFGIMGTVEARNGPWAIFGDAIYLSVANEDDAAVGPGIPASADVDLQGLVLAAGVGYDLVRSETYRLNGFGGLRYLDMDTTANIALGMGSQRLKDDFDNLDGIIGLRGQYVLSEKWNLVYYGDIGTGDTDLTWQAALAVEYKFDNWSLVGGYRHLAWEDLDSSDTLTDIDFSGPFVGAKFKL